MQGGALYQVKVDGWRVLAFIREDGVHLQARSGRDVTARFPEVIAALSALPSGTVLDGEVVAVRDGKFDFHQLARNSVQRRRDGASVSYVAFDLLCDGGRDVRDQPLADRWPRLLEVLGGALPQVQPVMSTTDRAEAEGWITALAPIGVEGALGKALSAPYTAGLGHGWVKVRTADTVDAEILDTAGPAALRVRLEDGREVTTEPLGPDAVHQVAEALADAPGPVRIEVRAGHGRHGVTRFVRVRAPE